MNAIRGVLPPLTSYRHPVTGAQVIIQVNGDAEMQCLAESGLYSPAVLARMTELTSQSAQNRQRIVKRLLGEDLVPPVTTGKSK